MLPNPGFVIACHATQLSDSSDPGVDKAYGFVAAIEKGWPNVIIEGDAVAVREANKESKKQKMKRPETDPDTTDYFHLPTAKQWRIKKEEKNGDARSRRRNEIRKKLRRNKESHITSSQISQK
ncbi:hypothetical protein V6N11_037390 [Hibiscus sabdariffa]|uniref:RNase H type-1 domain-containing protein n=1 Tax=Hibiscus sabdariffa TaxID=183260 RepID=A0ABR2P1S4_9ROSI